MSDQLEHVRELLQCLASALPNKFHKKVVIFGSSAMILNNVPMERPVDDLDVFVSPKTFKELKAHFKEKEKLGKGDERVPYLEISDRIEVLMSFPGVQFDEVMEGSHPLKEARPFCVASLSHLEQWKRQQGRDKDKKDLEAIKRMRGEINVGFKE